MKRECGGKGEGGGSWLPPGGGEGVEEKRSIKKKPRLYSLLTTVNMDSFLTNPESIRSVLEAGVRKEGEEGELNEQEVSQLLEGLDPAPQPPTPSTRAPRPKFTLRGEGGSGERASVPGGWEEGGSGGSITAPPQPQSPGEEEEEEGDSLVEEGGGVGGDVEAEAGDVSHGTPSVWTPSHPESKGELGEFKAYCEEQFQALYSMVQPLVGRLSALELRTSHSIPLATNLREGGRGSQASPPRHSRTRSGVGVPRAGAGPPTISKEIIGEFLRHNSTYPTFRAVRAAKLSALQSQLGLEVKALEPKVSDWTEEGLYTQLTIAHDD